MALDKLEIGAVCTGEKLNNLKFADDVNLIAEKIQDIQVLTDNVSNTSKQFGLAINEAKTKVMAIAKQRPRKNMNIK